MQQPNTSRPATKEERHHVTDFLQQEYFQSIYKHGVNTVDWLNLHHNDDAQERHVERDFTYIATIVEESDIHTYPGFFPDGDKIEVRVWPINFLNTFQQFKQFPDGRLERHLPAVKMKTDKPPAITQLKSALNEKIATSNEDSWICLVYVAITLKTTAFTRVMHREIALNPRRNCGQQNVMSARLADASSTGTPYRW